MRFSLFVKMSSFSLIPITDYTQYTAILINSGLYFQCELPDRIIGVHFKSETPNQTLMIPIETLSLQLEISL